MKKVIVSVISDLVTDMRVHKMCMTLQEMGFEVLLTGRKLPSSLPVDKRPYRHHRMKLIFTSGPLFYAFFNIRLFFFLLFRKAGVLVANDLDTLLANYLVSRLRNIPLVYDSHEYFTEVPELQGRFARKVWLAIEKRIFPHLKDVFTVNDSIAEAYNRKYGVRPLVVRNLPLKTPPVEPLPKSEAGIDDDKKIVILQGSGINLDRGGEEAVLAMQYVENAVLMIVGGGDALPGLKRMVREKQLDDKVIFIPRQPHHLLFRYTAMADAGLSLDKDTNLNYRFSLPNKIFDYIACGVPVLASDLPEVAKIVRDYDIGLVLGEYSVEAIAAAIGKMLSEDYKSLKNNNLQKAAKELTWEQNINTIHSVYSKFL
jgi:glycosyltransferase involved in cell wall biosynthesis